MVVILTCAMHLLDSFVLGWQYEVSVSHSSRYKSKLWFNDSFLSSDELHRAGGRHLEMFELYFNVINSIGV